MLARHPSARAQVDLPVGEPTAPDGHEAISNGTAARPEHFPSCSFPVCPLNGPPCTLACTPKSHARACLPEWASLPSDVRAKGARGVPLRAPKLVAASSWHGAAARAPSVMLAETVIRPTARFSDSHGRPRLCPAGPHCLATGESALLLAAGHTYLDSHARHTQIAKALLAAGASPNATDKRGRTAAHRACLAGNDGIVRLLLRAKDRVDWEMRDLDGATPFDLAAREGHAAIVSVLRERGHAHGCAAAPARRGSVR